MLNNGLPVNVSKYLPVNASKYLPVNVSKSVNASKYLSLNVSKYLSLNVYRYIFLCLSSLYHCILKTFSAGELLNIEDTYSHPLFYRGVDDATGFRTRYVLSLRW